MADTAQIIGKRMGEEPENETDHFIKCEVCGQMFDARNIGEVFHHAPSHHLPLEMHS